MRKLYLMITMILSLAAFSCQKEDTLDTGLTSVSNPMEGKSVYYKGETVEIKFKASDAWTADLEFKQGDGWAQIARLKGNDAAGDGSVRLNFDPNDSGEERTVTLWIRVKGTADNLGIELKQAGQPESSAMSEYLNAYMDEILAEDYLWADEYRALERDMTVSYD